jgi:hypothetical protein
MYTYTGEVIISRELDEDFLSEGTSSGVTSPCKPTLSDSGSSLKLI